MVLPAPAPHAPSRADAGETSWLARLSGILRLVRKGVLVLVDEARPERLGDLVRSLLPEHPDLEVEVSALSLARARPGGLVILAPTPEQAPWLNQERPLLANRSLRVVLFCDAETSIALDRRAPDFFHWISHRLACPSGPPAFAVRGIRSAMLARTAGVCWRGGDFEAAFAAALPGRPLTRASAALPFEAMVEAARPAGNAWVAWSDVTGPFRLRRVRWAMAEAGRRGRSVLLEPMSEAPGFAPVHGRVLGLADASAALGETGARHPGRLAALLNLEPEGVDLTAGLLKSGTEEATLEALLVGAEDPGMAVAALGAAKGMLTPAAMEVRMQTRTLAPREPDLIERLLREQTLDGERWLKGARHALVRGDADVAVHLAKRALALLGEDPRALTVTGHALEQQGSYAEAEAFLQRSLAIAEKTGRTGLEAYVEALQSRARIFIARGRYYEAANDLKKAISFEKARPDAEPASHAGLLSDLGVVYRELGHYTEAHKLLGSAGAILKRVSGKSTLDYKVTLAERANILSEQGRHEAAETYFRKLLTEDTAELTTDSPLMASIMAGLGQSLLEQGKYAQAEPFLRKAAALQEATLGKQHRSRGASLLNLATSLFGQGKHTEAESLSLEALSIAEKSLGERSPAYAASLHILANIYNRGGEYEQAEAMLRDALRVEEDILGLEHPELCATLSNLALVVDARGRLEEAEALEKRSAAIASKKLGARHPSTATILHLLAYLQAQRGSPDAKATAKRAIKALTHAFGPDEPRIRELEKILEDAVPIRAT